VNAQVKGALYSLWLVFLGLDFLRGAIMDFLRKRRGSGFWI